MIHLLFLEQSLFLYETSGVHKYPDKSRYYITAFYLDEINANNCLFYKIIKIFNFFSWIHDNLALNNYGQLFKCLKWPLLLTISLLGPINLQNFLSIVSGSIQVLGLKVILRIKLQSNISSNFHVWRQLIELWSDML